MPPDLPSLPIEILIAIVESVDGKHSRLVLCEALRLSCKNINEKLIRYHVVTFYKRIRVRLSETDFLELYHLSRGPLTEHIESISIDCSSMMLQRDPNCNLINGNIEPLLEHCSRLLKPILQGLPNLREFHVMQPKILSKGFRLKSDLRHETWTSIVTRLFLITLEHVQGLEVLTTPLILTTLGHTLHIKTSILEKMLDYPKQLNNLKKFGINLLYASPEHNTKNSDGDKFWQLLNSSSKLDELHFGIDKWYNNQLSFRSISNRLNTHHRFRRLSLSLLKLKVHDLTKFLRSQKETLEVLVLDRIHVLDEVYYIGDLQLSSLCLKSITLRFLNFDESGLNFWNTCRDRPVYEDIIEDSLLLEERDWVLVSHYDEHGFELILNTEEGDDVRYWLGVLDTKFAWGPFWYWENYVGRC